MLFSDWWDRCHPTIVLVETRGSNSRGWKITGAWLQEQRKPGTGEREARESRCRGHVDTTRSHVAQIIKRPEVPSNRQKPEESQMQRRIIFFPHIISHAQLFNDFIS